MISSYLRGHKIISYNYHDWFYADDGTTANVERPCKRCGRIPTLEGYDACLGQIEGVVSACCGHGVEDGYYMTECFGAKYKMKE